MFRIELKKLSALYALDIYAGKVKIFSDILQGSRSGAIEKAFRIAAGLQVEAPAFIIR